jgi:excisionase family DNA binding protein
VNNGLSVEKKVDASIPSDSEAEDIITPKELAARLHCSVGTTQALRRRGVLPTIILPGSRLVRFSWKSVQEALRRMERIASL